jgi:hypothetical protein
MRAVTQLIGIETHMEDLVKEEAKKVAPETTLLILTHMYAREPCFPIHAIFNEIETKEGKNDSKKAMPPFITMITEKMGPKVDPNGDNESDLRFPFN